MKGLRRKFRRGLAGFLAFVLTMTSFNMVSWADVASAFETEKATFVMSGEEIRESAQAAIDSGSTFHFEDLGIEESEDNAKDYQKLFGSGSVYEIAPSYNMSDDEDADGADLRVFVRIKDDYEGYRLTGKEEIIFLYINDSEGKISFRTIVDGYATERITVKGNSKLAEAEVPGNVNGTLEGEVTTPEENGTPEGEVTTPEESGTPESEVTTPEENGTPESEVTAPEESGTPESEVTTPEENGTPEGEMATPEESGTPEGEVTTPEESGTSEGEVTTPEENRTPEGEVTTPEESGTPEGEVTTPEENRTPEEEVTTPEENGTLEGESDNEDAAMSEDNTVVSISRNSSAVLMSADSTVTVLESANEKNDKITLATASNSENSNSGKSDPKESSSVANLVNGKVYGNVILDESSYARAYVITLDALNIEQPLNEYQIKVTHRLHGDNWIDYEKIETVTITDNDFDNGEYDTAKLEFKREGIVLTSQSLVLTKDAFKSGTEAEITLEYAVADGYRIYDNRANLRSIFVGELDDDDPVIKPVGQAVVNIKYVYENGTIAKDTESVAALYDENTKKYKLTYELGDLDGYKPVLDTMDSASGITLDGNILTANLSEDKEYLAVIVYMADTVEYVVRHNYQKLDGSYEVKESETKSGKAGELSAAVAQNVTGFTPKQISQKELSATEENIVDIFYDRNIYDLTYSTDGGEYVERQTGLYGESLTVAKSTTKAGYLFDGWYTDKNFSQGTRVSGSIVLEDNTILYAKWNPGTVGYKVVYLIENADDNNYSLLCTDAKTGKTGDNVQITAKTANPTNWGELEKNAFTFKDSTSEVLKADGTSIVTVRYSRNTYTIRFQDKSPTLCRMESHTHTLSNCYKRTCNKLHKHNESCYDMSYTICGLTEHQHDSTCYTRDISAKYQANIREQWLENYGGHNWLWSGSSYTSLQDIMPYVSGNGIKVLNKHNDGPTPRPLEYYVEDPNGTIKDPKGGSTKFSLYTKITIYLEKGSTPSWDEEYYEIDGYERYYTNIDFSHPSFKNPSTFYYTRAKYDLTLINGTNETTKKDIPYKSDISKYLGAPTVKPTSDATFDAWYVDSSFTEKYTSGTMPKGNLVLYAHWNNAAYDVTFKDGQEILDTVEVNSGELVTPISTPEKAGYSFTGWYIDEACTQRYDFQRKVESDFDLYAGWSMHSTTSYQILYVTSEGDPVADSVTGNGVIGDTIQANAVVPTIAGYEDYIVDKATASISLDADPNKNVIRFIYSSPESLRYTVQYWYEDKIVAEEANIASKLSSFRCYPNTDLEQLTGYKVKEAYKNVKLTTGENIIKFTLTLNEYTITYENVDYNDIVWENGNTNPTKYNIRTNSFTLKNPGRVGYTFMGWKLVKGSVESGEYDSKNVVIETGSRGNLTFKAEWAVDVNQKLNYSIKYYKSEQPDKEIGNLNKNVLVASPTVKYADVDKTYNKPSGYILDKVEFGGQTVSDGEMTITDTDNIIKVYYKVDETQKLKYSVEYYIDGKDIPFDKLDNQEVLVADPVVSEVADSSKVPAGYTRDSVLPELPATISETANVIRVYYKVDETQKLKYSVEYYVTGNNTPFDKLENQEVLVADPVVKAVADSSKVPVGYTRDSVYPKLPVTISVSNNVIRVYYKVDETQKLKYSVEYYVTGNDTPFDKLENQEVLVADPVVKAVSDSSKVPAGYTRDSVLPELPATISETANVIKVYYRVDETQKLKYSVEYYINGNDTAFDKLENQEVLAADPVVKTVADSSKVPAGYRRDSVFPELPVTITESSNIIKVYYRIDTTQKLQFDVEYYLVGEMEAFDAVRNQTVLVANPVINAVADSSKVPAGYERASVMPQLPTIISKTNNVIRVYYKVDETQKLKYSIEYYVTGNETAFDKLENQEVLVANPVVSTVADSSKVPAGYTRDRVLPELPTTISGSNNVIRVYYKVDETQKLKYSVEYYLNGNDTAFDKLENQEVLVADPVVKAVSDSSKVPVGYTRDSVLPELPATISETANIIKVYYRVDETQKLKYSVEYYVTGNDTAFDKLENQEVLAADPVVKAVADSSKVPAGYTRDSVLPELPATISETANVIKVYYRVDETQKLKYSVE
ncbi:InlB B-repeat-containing protein, partial [Hungatella sp.]|uniref:InlB B-repeat-containing protein n=1 Tax=Hungatella sp. TaxID=2613924 RepID=UPI0025855881